MAKVFLHIPGVYFTEVFAPVETYSKTLSLIVLAVYFRWNRSQIDVKNVFVNGPLKWEINVEQPASFIEKGSEKRVYQLKRAPSTLLKVSRK